MLTARHVHRSLNERFTLLGYNAVEVFGALGASFMAFMLGQYVGLGGKAFIVTAFASALLIVYGKRKDPQFFLKTILGRRYKPELDAIKSSEVTWYTKVR